MIVEVDRTPVWRELGWWAGHGAVAGILAGVLFIMFQMLVAAFQTAGEGFFLPLRAMSTLFAGPDGMQPDYPLVRAAVTGLSAHLLLAATGGAVFGLVARLIPGVATSDVGLIVLGTLWGMFLWLLAGLGLAPIGWSSYLELSDSPIQLLAYIVFFGASLGSYFAYVRPRRSGDRDWMTRTHSQYARPGAHRAA